MINGITLKVCGIGSVNDAVAAAGVGADYLGFVFNEASPRHVSEGRFRRMLPALPAVKRVAVIDTPAPADLARLGRLGFEVFQVRFDPKGGGAGVREWAEAARPAKLWLAPRLVRGGGVEAAWLESADAILVEVSDSDDGAGWDDFRRLAQAHPEQTWILSGVLGPDNIVGAVDASDALFIDVGAGVEESPGVKSQEKLFALWRALERL